MAGNRGNGGITCGKLCGMAITRHRLLRNSREIFIKPTMALRKGLRVGSNRFDTAAITGFM
jgi:hypothetical protein